MNLFKVGYNRPFPSSPVPLFQNESKCETFHMKMSSACSMQFHFHANQSHFHKNGFALKLALKQRHKGTRKSPVDKRNNKHPLVFFLHGGGGLSSMVNRIRDIERVASYCPGCVSSRKLTIFLDKK